MAVFDNELIDNISNRENNTPSPIVQSPTITEVDTSLDVYGNDSINEAGLTIDELSNLAVEQRSTVDSPFQSVPRSELHNNQRFPLYERGKDLENIYGLQQSWADRLANGAVKFGATAIGTFTQGFAAIPNTITAIKSGKLSDVSNSDGYEASIDNWLKNLEDHFPNYYTRQEKAHPFVSMIPFTSGSANFWGDKVVKNLGFTAGAIANAIVTDLAIGAVTGGIGEIPLVASQVGKASLWLNKLFVGTNRVDEVLSLARTLGKTEQQILNIKKLGELSSTVRLTSGPRYAMSIYGSARTEAAIEARDSYNRVKEELINQYKLENLGEEPSGEDLSNIESYAENAMNTRFGINMALLTVSNTVQFGNLLKSFNKTSRAISSLDNIALKQGSIDSFEKIVPIGTVAKVWDSVRPTIKNVFAEGVYEEGGQFATEKGVYNYYTRKYKSPNNQANWNDLNEVISSVTQGLKDQFGTTEGVENMVIGAITAVISGGISNKIQSSKEGSKDNRLNTTLNILNQYGITGTLAQQYSDTLNNVSIAKEMEEAVKAGDVYKYKNLQKDMFFNFVMSRIPSDLHDVTLSQLNMLNDLPKEEFERMFGMEFTETSKSTVADYTNSLINEAQHIKKVYDSVNNTFKNPFTLFVNPQTAEQVEQTKKYNTFNEWKANLVYYGTEARTINNQLREIQDAVSNLDAAIDIDLLALLTNTSTLKELGREYETEANQLNKTITEHTSAKDKKEIRDRIKALRTRSERINLSLSGKYDEKTFNSLLNFELNNRDAKQPNVVGNENSIALLNYGVDVNRVNDRKKKASESFDALSSEEGFNKFFNQEEEIPEAEVVEEGPTTGPEIVTRSGVKEPISIGSEYLSHSDKKATIKKLADDRWEISHPNGTSQFRSTEEAARDAQNEVNEEIASRKKIKVITVNTDNSIKVEDVNGDIYDIAADQLVGYERILSEQEKLKKFKEDLDKEQKDIETGSGTSSTNDLPSDIKFSTWEEKKKAADILFTSTTGASEDFEVSKLSPHHLRSIEFLNNVKNFKNKTNIKTILVTPNQETSLGLDGLAALSMEGSGLDKNKYSDINEGFVAAVYVEKNGSEVFFIDKNGKKLSKVGESVDLNNVVFSTMPSTHLVWGDGKTPRYRTGEKEKATEQAKRWELKRKQLFSLAEGKYEIYSFSISRGIPDIVDQYEKNYVGETLVPEDKISTQEGLVVVPTNGTIFHQGQLLKFPNGRPVLQYEDTLQFLNNSTFNSDQIDTLFEVIKQLASEVKTQLAEGERVKLNRKYTKFLQHVLFYKKGAKLSANQVFIDTNTMEIRLGDKRWDFTKIEEAQKEIKEALSDTYSSVNNRTLTKYFSEPFTELYLENNTLKDRKWANYQTYLLSGSNPDGSKRDIADIPLSTAVHPITEAIPYNYKQKYAILQGMEFPELKVTKVKTKPEPKPTQAPKMGSHVVDGKTINTYQLKSGPVPFTASLDEKGELSVNVEVNDTITKIAENKDIVNKTIVPLLKQLELFDATKSDEQMVLDFVANTIVASLKKLQEPEISPKKEEVPAVKLTEEQAGIQKKIDIRREEIERLKDPSVAQKNAVTIGMSLPDYRVYVKREITKKEKEIEELSLQLNSLQTPSSIKGKDFYDTKTPPNTEYRKVAGEVPRMSPSELEVFKQWHAANVPNIPYQVLENIITTHDGEKAWGSFENGVAKFYRSAAKGTEYHEIFEGIYKAFLSTEEQQALLDEFKAKSGTFTDRQSGRKIAYDEATDLQAKERIADDFADFRLGKLPARSLGQRIVNFFRNIIEFFKQFVSKPSKKELLFKAIDAGKFKGNVIPEAAISHLAEYKRIEGLSEQQTNAFVEDITARVRQIIMPDKSNLYNPLKLTSSEIFNQIRDVYIDEGKIDNNNPERLTTKQFDDLIIRTKEFLRTFKIEFDEDSILTINEEGKDRTLYAPEPFSTDWKKSSPFAIKFALGGMTETVATNQEHSSSFELPEQKLSDISGYKLLNFSRVFATLMDKLGNTTDVKEIENKVIVLAKSDSNYVRLFTMLGGNRTAMSIDFPKFSDADWRLFVNFYQTFSKQKPEALIQYINGGEVFTASANLFTSAKEVQRSWIENIKALSKEQDSLITYNKSTKTYKVGDISEVQIKSPVQMSEFLGSVGIDFPLDVVNRLKHDNGETKQFAESVAAIYKHLGSENNIMSVTGRTLGISGPLTTLSELLVKITNPPQDLSYFGIDQKKRQMFSDNNAISILENDFNSANNLDELLEKRPELEEGIFGNSQVLKRGGLFFDKEGKRIQKLKVSYIQGTENVDAHRSTATSSLSKGDRFTQEINQNLNGNYYILVPADSSTEWMMNLGNTIKYEEVESGEAWTKIYNIFKGYLRDDIALAKQNYTYLRNVAPRAQELRFFKDILPSSLLNKVNNLILTGATDESIDLFINENISSINASVKAFIENDVQDILSILTNNSQIIPTSETTFIYRGLNSSFAKSEGLNKFNLHLSDVTRLLTFTQVNYIINNIELHTILFGDPFQFAVKNNQLDETKRIKSFLSPRRTTFDIPEFNTYLNQKYNEVGGIQLTEKDPGYHLHKAYTKTVTFDDVNVLGSLSEINPAYKKVNEADSSSWIMDNTYKEVKLKNGQWSEEAEAWHQWQMAYTRQNMPGYKYSSDKLKDHDIRLLSTPEPKYVIEVLKPIVSGSKYEKTGIDIVLDKFSQMPIYYSMVEGTNLEKFYIKMFKEQIGYGIVLSGRKVGAEALHNLYTENGQFNEDVFNNIIEIPWKIYGIQVENSHDGSKEQTRGSQLTKISSLDLYDNGIASPEAQKEYKTNLHILNLMHQNGYKSLLKKLGIEDLDGTFKLVDNASVEHSLEREMLRREAPENLKDTIQRDENGEFRIPFEASSAYIQIKDILYSMVDKAIGSPKMNGGAHVQVPSTMWESSGEGRKVVDVNGKKVFTSSFLKFYTKEDPYMEVLLPAWFKDKLNLGNRFKTDEAILSYLNKSEEGRSILKGIGFRIPTQSLSSIENIRVKGFLPAYMGSTVVVPSEITTKAGSDFDIDKLNMYLKSVYIDEKGDIKLVKYKGSEEATREFYSNVFDKKLEKKTITSTNLLEALQLIHQGKEYAEKHDTKGLINRYADLLNTIISETTDLSAKEEELLQKIEQYGNAGLQEGLKKEFLDEMYKRSLENEYYDSLERLLILPENFERLISPVDDAGLKSLSVKLDDIRGEQEEKLKNRILNRGYLTALRHSFVLGKKWVGIGAVNITGHSLTQKSKIVLEPSRFELVPEFDRKWLGDGSIVLPHNSIDGKVSLSGKKTIDGKFYISDRLSGYITSFVDVAKDPYILKIIKSDLAVGVFMFLERIGVGENTALFMNQPIIARYLEHLDSINARGLYNKKNIDYIKSQFISTDAQIQSAQIAVNGLENNIKKFYEKGKFENISDNAVQHKIFDEFLKYAKMAEYNFKLSQAFNYDNTKFRSADTLFKKQEKTNEAIESNIFSSVTRILDGSHIGEQALLLGYATEAIGEILKLDQYDIRSKTINPILKSYSRNQYLSNAKYDRISSKVIASLIDFIVQTKSSLGGEIKTLLVDTGTSVAQQLAIAKRDHPELELLKELEIVSSPRVNGAKSLKLKANLKTAYDDNLYTEKFRELKSALPKLYDDIVKLSILQGTYQSAISISNVIPLEDRAAIIAPIIQSISADTTLDAFAKGAFHRNHWKDEDIFHRVLPKFFSQDTPVAEDISGNEIYQYLSPAFPGMPNLNIKPSDRKILILSEKYNLFDIQHDYILVPRVVENPKTGERVDMVNGRTVTNAMFKARSVRGDLSLKDVFGYQKVKYANGSPVITYDEKGNGSHVYKLINLWGDGQFASEYYTEFKRSVFDNGTVKLNQEIPDADIIAYFAPKIELTATAKENTIATTPNQLPLSGDDQIPPCA